MPKTDLEQENEKLKKKLRAAEVWMQKEVQGNIYSLAKKHIHQEGEIQSSLLLSEEMTEIISERIHTFFSDIPMNTIPDGCIESLVRSEVSLYLKEKGIDIELLSMSIGYQNCIEKIIFSLITKPFQKFGKTHIHPCKSPTALDDILKKVIEKHYSLGIGKLFEILQTPEDQRSSYIEGFFQFLETDTTLKNTLLEPNFLIQLQHVVESEVFGSKRHTGDTSYEDIKNIRLWCLGNFQDKNCIAYRLLSTARIA